jgi:hypothetical protein
MRGLAILFILGISAQGQVFNPVAKERGPESVPKLPLDVRLDLVKRKCMVPQYKGSTSADGAYTSGHFRSGAAIDYAVVCHIPSRKVQNVLVYSNSDGAWTAEIIERGTFGPPPEGNNCQREVSIATSKSIVDFAHAFAPEELKHLPKLDHEGVNVEICEKASVIYYLHQGKWLKLQGSD